ncbi:carboxypeptidase-like regulatory domain-containing protein [Flavobacterium fluviatile]|uniref:carboxypeptidase-like regulatory domain-containing protein n=1 Tax=Flavobacterium fluviatile TaxID=1862387 RepID=UPI001FCA66B4|nr:carboxypeptidase-like regulatory domain-containing protein [Flavobacterium fluviatile]
MKTNKAFLSLFLFIQISFGQTSFGSKEIHGQIVAEDNLIEEVNIINNTTQIATISDADGKFSITVKEGDVLVFSSMNLEAVKHRITAEDLVSNLLQIKMNAENNELKEVIVNENSNITAENLGIIPKGQKKYTPAERKLATAGDFKPVDLLGILGGSLDVDPIINKINGRTKKLKKNVEVEKKERNVEKLGYLFEDTYFIDYLKIPSEYVRGFKFYIVESQYAGMLLEEKDKSKLTLLISELALKYKEIIAGETK